MLLQTMLVGWFLASTAHAAGPTSPGVPVKRVVAPEHVIEGVRSVQVSDFAGRNGGAIAMEIRAGLQDTERLATDAAAIGKELARTGTDIASKLASSAVGGGIQGKIAEGLTKNVSKGVQDGLEVEPVQLDDGLKLDVWQVKTSGADAVIGGSVRVSQETTDSTRKVAEKDDDGDLVKDSEGRTVYREIPCKARKVAVEVAWSVTKTGGEALVAKSFVMNNGDSRCGEDIQYLASPEELADGVLAGTGARIVRLIAPSWKVLRLPMSKDRTLRAENQLARAGNHFEAMCGLRGLLGFDENLATAVMNLGVLEEALGYYDLAAAQYAKANALRGDKPTARAMNRVATRSADVKRMVAAYGLTWKIADSPDFVACPPIPSGRRVSVKRDTRLMSDAKGGDILVELTRGMVLFVLDDSSSPHRVALIDGSEGWVDSKYLK